MARHAGAIRVSSTGVVVTGPVLFSGFVFDTNVSEDKITIYDGLDAESGDEKFNTRGWVSDNNGVFFGVAVLFERGLYVVFDDDIEDATFIVQPLHSDFIDRPHHHGNGR